MRHPAYARRQRSRFVAVIFGAGSIGLLFLAALWANGVRCVVVEPGQARADTAKLMGGQVVSYVGENVFPSAIRLLESGLVDLAPIVSQVVPFDDTEKAFAAMRRGEVVKLVVRVRDN